MGDNPNAPASGAGNGASNGATAGSGRGKSWAERVSRQPSAGAGAGGSNSPPRGPAYRPQQGRGRGGRGGPRSPDQKFNDYNGRDNHHNGRGRGQGPQRVAWGPRGENRAGSAALPPLTHEQPPPPNGPLGPWHYPTSPNLVVLPNRSGGHGRGSPADAAGHHHSVPHPPPPTSFAGSFSSPTPPAPNVAQTVSPQQSLRPGQHPQQPSDPFVNSQSPHPRQFGPGDIPGNRLLPRPSPHSVTPIKQTDEYVQLLWTLVHPVSALEKKGYVMDNPTLRELTKKVKCKFCLKACTSHDFDMSSPDDEDGDNGNGNHDEPDNFWGDPPGPGEGTRMAVATQSTVWGSNRTEPRCRYHSGALLHGRWSCCGGHVQAVPCKKASKHTARTALPAELIAQWTYERTPYARPANPHTAVVVDCEMGVSHTGDSELIRVSLVDYFSGRVLVDSLVLPDVPMRHWNTRYSGVSARDMEVARRAGTYLSGRDAARAALLEFVGSDTIVAGHGCNADMTSLRWIHPMIIDTLLVEDARRKAAEPPPSEKPGGVEGGEGGEGEEEDGGVGATNTNGEDRGGGRAKASAAGPEKSEVKPGEPEQKPRRSRVRDPKGMSLKALAMDRLGREIQVGAHDSVEDALATRDVLHWLVTNPPPPRAAAEAWEAGGAGAPETSDAAEAAAAAKEAAVASVWTDDW